LQFITIKCIIKVWWGDTINIIQFNNMELLKQIEYINNKVIAGYELTKICEVIGMGSAGIRDRLIEEDSYH
jgi:hypothetical protein